MNNGRPNPNMANAQQHGMNRQPRPHPHQQGNNPNFNQQAQRRVPPPGSGQQQNRPNQVPGQRPHNVRFSTFHLTVRFKSIGTSVHLK